MRWKARGEKGDFSCTSSIRNENGKVKKVTARGAWRVERRNEIFLFLSMKDDENMKVTALRGGANFPLKRL